MKTHVKIALTEHELDLIIEVLNVHNYLLKSNETEDLLYKLCCGKALLKVSNDEN